MFQWRSFDFFDATQIKIDDEDTRAFLESNDISSVCSGSDSLFFGSYDGQVRIVAASWKVVRSFQAYDNGPITHMHQVEGTSLLVTVAVRIFAMQPCPPRLTLHPLIHRRRNRPAAMRPAPPFSECGRWTSRSRKQVFPPV